MPHNVSEKKMEEWLLENIKQDFQVNVTMKPKQKKEDPKKYKDRLKRLNEMYLLGNIDQDEYKQKSAEIQQKLAEIAKIAPLKTKIFAANWKDLYAELDDIHRRSFWRKLIKEIHITVENSEVEIIY